MFTRKMWKNWIKWIGNLYQSKKKLFLNLNARLLKPFNMTSKVSHYKRQIESRVLCAVMACLHYNFL